MELDLAAGPPSCERSHEPSPSSSFGLPGRKPYLDLVDLLALLLSLVCLVVAICTISPRLHLAWYLGYTSQIIVIGFLLSIMNLCLNRAIPALFFMTEARFGASTLQNYEAILRNQPLSAARVSTIWRLTLLSNIALPIFLSAGYKRYTGGTAHALIAKDNIPYNMYGATALPGLNQLGDSISYAQLINATLPFLSASKDDDSFPSTLPRCYGQNTLVLSNTSTALLDMPMPDLVTKIQQSLLTGETKSLSASVHAFVTTYNQSAEQYRNDDNYWNQYYGEDTLTETTLFTGYVVYTLMNNLKINPVNDGTWLFVAMIEDFSEFNQSALRFDTHRHECHATWDISIQSMVLVQASCDTDPLPASNQEIITSEGMAVAYWYTAILADNIGLFSGPRSESPWRLPTYVTSIASMYWARYSAFTGPSSGGRTTQLAQNTLEPYELYYPVDDQVVISTKVSIDPKWSLYCILTLQPLLILLILAFKSFFHSAPIGEGFGLITILAGINKESLGALRGASLTGKLRKPVRLAIRTVDTIYHETEEEHKAPSSDYLHRARRIEFTVNGQGRNGILKKDQICL